MKKIAHSLLNFLLLLALISCQQQASDTTVAIGKRIPAPELKRMSYELYGLDVKSKEILQGTLGENQFMQDVLKQHDVHHTQIDAMEQKSGQVFDVRKMRAGNAYTLVKNTQNKVEFFIYEKSPTDFVVFDFSDTLSVYEGSQAAIHREIAIGGQVQSTLYQTIKSLGLEVRLAKSLEEIFAWTVDFSHLETTDFFKVIFEEAYVDEESIGMTKILAAQFHHDGEDYYAFYHEDDSLINYFDHDGLSVKKSFLQSPLKYTVTNAGQEVSPSLRNRQQRLYVASEGTPVQAVARGRIIQLKNNSREPIVIKIDHGNGYQTVYQNLGELVDSLVNGSLVNQGELIGSVGPGVNGESGSFSLQYLKNGKPVRPIANDPYQLANDSLPKVFMNQFVSARKNLERGLQNISLVLPDNEQ
ncbi:MAG: peptidoglycan DD-metalloendopeptidase family protein [Bacteroidota bacterium]